ncbi:hypothetical protein CBL_13642 [Carabus blaptoides fortunei]
MVLVQIPRQLGFLHSSLVNVVRADQFAGCTFYLPQLSRKVDVHHCAVVTVSNSGARGGVSGESIAAVAVSVGVVGGSTRAVALQRQETETTATVSFGRKDKSELLEWPRLWKGAKACKRALLAKTLIKTCK